MRIIALSMLLLGLAMFCPSPVFPEATGHVATVRLSLLDAVAQALEANQKIRVKSYDPQKASQELKAAEAVYDTAVVLSGNAGRTKRPVSSLLDTGNLNALRERKWSARAGVKKLFPTGATLAIYQDLDRLDSNSLYVVPNPQATSRLVVEVSQPLLRGFWDRNNRALIQVAKLNVAISHEEFRQTVMDVVAEVARIYWQLVLETELEQIGKSNVEMAAEVYRREEVRLDKGLATRLDVDRAAAALELRRADLFRTQARRRILVDQLKNLLGYPEDFPDIFPATPPVTTPMAVNASEALDTAFKHRPELERALKVVSANEVRRDLARHNQLPKLDAVFRLTKSGLGRDYGRAFDTVYGEAYNSWLAALEFEYPLGHRAAKAEYTRSVLEYDQSRLEVQRLRDQIATEVQLALREVTLARQEIPTTLQAKEAAARVVESEYARFELGQKTNEELLRAQDFLAATAREYARAVLNYNIALVSLSRAKGTLLPDLGINLKE